jgi:hypothetical protein
MFVDNKGIIIGSISKTDTQQNHQKKKGQNQIQTIVHKTQQKTND